MGAARAAPNARVEQCPIADGGEGTLEVLAALDASWRWRSARVSGPNGAPLDAKWLLSADGTTAIVESAEAVALAHCTARAPLTATSAGVGELVALAIAAGARRVVLTLGGSATTDGGAGMLRALGAVIDDARVDLAPARARLAGIELSVACDVDNPLLGEAGAARVYAPQKGASPRDVDELEARLARFAAATEPELAAAGGAGAAGGLGFGALLLGARAMRGCDWLLDRVGFDARLDAATLVLTAEGRLDAQSLRGKAVIAVAERAARRGVPVIAIAGAVDVDPAALRARGIVAAFSLCPRPCSEAEARAEARPWLERAAEHAVACHGVPAPHQQK